MTILATRKKWLALILSSIMPGLGQIYCGDLLRGGCFLVFFIFSPLLLISLTVQLPDSYMLLGSGIALSFSLFIYLLALVDTWRVAGSTGVHYQLRNFNDPVFYLAAWLLGTVLILGTEQYLKRNVIEAFKIVGQSMEPTILKGDYVLAKKPAFRDGRLKKGDIVIAVYPDDRSIVLIRQITALPGDRFVKTNRSSATVPHGTVIVKGGKMAALDSNTFGPLDMRDIVGKVTHIYFSRDEDSIRWNRFFKPVNSIAMENSL